MAITMSDILELSVEERILLAEDIWDSIAALPGEIKLSAAQKEELDLRLEAYHKNTESTSPWEDVKRRIIKRKV